MEIKHLIFGGSGFIGQHLINQLDSNYLNLDINEVQGNYKYCDVRKAIDIRPEKSIDIIYNLAAIHTTPGHEYHEYFETNIKGAENVCNFARKYNINKIVFTSSIAPYGSWEDEKTEESLPLPTSAYGSSKLVAEEIHKRWQAEKSDERKLIIIRPGVVFGQNEGGNFTRFYRAMKTGRFFYPGRKDTKKAAIYVKDLVRIITILANDSSLGVTLYNACYPEPHSIKEICQAISKVTNTKMPRLKMPAILLRIIASLLYSSGKLFGLELNGIHPDRVEKLMISTNVSGKKLDKIIKLDFSLKEALEDWYFDCDNDSLY